MLRSSTNNGKDIGGTGVYIYDAGVLLNENVISSIISTLNIRPATADTSTTTTFGFLSSDPIGHAGGDYNLYRYVANSPLTHTDPSGLQGQPGQANTQFSTKLVPSQSTWAGSSLLNAGRTLTDSVDSGNVFADPAITSSLVHSASVANSSVRSLPILTSPIYSASGNSLQFSPGTIGSSLSLMGSTTMGGTNDTVFLDQAMFYGGQSLRAAGGAIEVFGGSAMVSGGTASAPTGAGLVVAGLGTVAVAHGADTFTGAVRSMYYGQNMNSLTHQGLVGIGFDEGTAIKLDASVGVLSLSAGNLLSRTPHAALTSTSSIVATSSNVPYGVGSGRNTTPAFAVQSSGITLSAPVNLLSTNANQAVFWSGIGRAGDQRAAAWVSQNGGATLETTLASTGVQLPRWNPNDPVVVAAWRQASVDFANGASGNVRVLQGDILRTNAVFRDEYKTLINNANVESVISINPESGAQIRLWP